jgi:hypothetical protein
MSLALSKTYAPSDLEVLATELVVVDAFFTSAREQHGARRWEYGMALHALHAWATQHGPADVIYDVGGAGSPLRHMTNALVIDPDETGQKMRLAQFVTTNPRMAAVVFSISTLEHVKDLDQFLYHLACLVAPGGLLFLTMDCWNRSGPDTAHFSWMRERIFAMHDWSDLADTFCGTINYGHGGYGFAPFGGVDWRYHGDHLYGSYSFCSLALIKRA